MINKHNHKNELTSSFKRHNTSSVILPFTDIPAQLFVYGINRNTTEEQLKQHFSQSGSVISIFVPQSKGQNRGFGFITMKNKEQAERIIVSLNRSELDKNLIFVQIIENCPILIKKEDSQSITIKQILESKVQTEEFKIKALQEVYATYEEENIYNLLIHFDSDTFSIMSQRMNYLQSEPEFLILNIIQLFNKRISELISLYDDPRESLRTLLFDEMNDSGLITNIESLIMKKIKIVEEKEDQSFYSVFEQLVRIYLMIKKDFDISDEILQICAIVISRNLSALINILKRNNKQQQYNDKNINNEIDELNKNKIQSMSQTLRAFYSTLCNINNNAYLVDQFKIHMNIAPLIHICCPNEINCPLNINVKLTSNLCTLQINAFKVIRKLICYLWNNTKVQSYYTNIHNILPHLTIPIISFASSNQIHKYQIKDQQQSFLQYSPSIINTYLNLFHDIIYDNNTNCQSAVSTNKLISSLIKLCQYNKKQICKQQSEEENNIRIVSRQCLFVIHQFGDETAQTQLLYEQYINMLIVVIGTSYIYYQENNNELVKILSDLCEFFTKLHQRKDIDQLHPQIKSLFLQPDLIKRSEEQIEEQCGNEEIESLLFNNENTYLSDCAFKTKNSIINLFSLNQIEIPNFMNGF